MADSGLALQLLESVRELDRAGLNKGTAGNVSVRQDDGMLITPTGVPSASMESHMMVHVSLDGGWTGQWRPSSEWAMHAAIYKAFAEAQAVVHTHADHCVALSCLREDLPAFHYMVASFGGNTVRCARYAPFGTPDLATSAVEALRGRTACLLANHGMICHGRDLARAVAAAAKLETLARQYAIARGLGTPILLDEEEMVRILGRYGTYGQQRRA